MNTLSIPFLGRVFSYTFPSQYSELSAWQLRRIVPLLPRITRAYELSQQQESLALARESDTELQKLRMAAFLILANLRPWQILKRLVLFSMYADEFEYVLRATNFLVTTDDYSFELPLKLRIKGRKLAGPGLHLRYLTGQEFHFASDRYQKLRNFRGDGSPSAAMERQALANELIYCLFRPEDYKYAAPHSPVYRDDTREDYNRFALEKRARLMTRLDPRDRTVIIWWYNLQMQSVMAAYPRIFKKNKGKADRQGWLPVFRLLAKGLSEQDRIAEMRMGRLLYELDETIQENQRLLQKSKAK